MKKHLKLIVCLVLAVCVTTGCAYLPLLAEQIARSGTQAEASGSSAGFSADTAETSDSDTVTISRAEYERYQQLDTLLEAADLVDTYYYQDTDKEKMLDGAIQGMLMSLGDPYTYYYNPESYAEMWADDEGNYGGIGIQISASYVTGECTVSRVFSGTPAMTSGIHKGDILRQVEDLTVTTTTLNDAVKIMRGELGAEVTVTVERAGEALTFVIPRAEITVNRVDAKMLDDTTGYICLYEFAGDCVTAFNTALSDLMAQGATSLILDLRDDPGGWVDDAAEIADNFLDGGTVCYFEYKDGSREYYSATAGKKDLKLVVLVNENSASSSEILAGALKERADATVVGTQSYGKGIVQFVLPLGNSGAGIQVTAAQYYTPDGNAVHEIGITPDVTVELPEGDNGMYEFGDMSDPQLAEAYRVITQRSDDTSI